MECVDDFSLIASDSEKAQRERLVIIKEACGNAGLSILVSLMIIIITLFKCEYDDLSKICIRNIHFILLVIGVETYLFKMHYIHVDRQFRFMMNVLKRKNKKVD